MSQFLDSEAEESDDSQLSDEQDRRKAKKNKAFDSSDEDEDDEDDDERAQEDLKDLIDDGPIEEEEDGDDSDHSGGSKKRKRHSDDLDDRLEDDDYDLIEENLGVRVERQHYKRVRRFQDNESDNEEENFDKGVDREAIADQLFDESEANAQSVDHQSECSVREREREREEFDDVEEESESDADDFIVDDNGRPIAEKKKKRKVIFSDAALQEGQDIFGVDFDYGNFQRFEDDYEEESDGDEDYDEEEGEERRVKKKAAAKKHSKKTIYDIFEPSELKRSHFTDVDNEIRKTDVPERMQLRAVPVTDAEEKEIRDEAMWIYEQVFFKLPVSQREKFDVSAYRKPPTVEVPIRHTLDYIRNQNLDVPFIANYRKEYVKPHLSTEDLWKIYDWDERWCNLSNRKSQLMRLVKSMRDYQEDNPDLADDVRKIEHRDIDAVNEIQTVEEWRDVHMHFILHYSRDVPQMQEQMRQKRKEERRREREAKRAAAQQNGDGELEGDGEDCVLVNIDDNESDLEDDGAKKSEYQVKLLKDGGQYAMCRRAGICSFAKHFGLAPHEFAENLSQGYQKNSIKAATQAPRELARQFESARFKTVEERIDAAKFVVARQLSREPILRKAVREVIFERAKINVYPTVRGKHEIDENHPCYSMKYLKRKPVRDLVDDQWLKLTLAEEDKLLTIEFCEDIEGNTSSKTTFLEEAKQLYHLEEFSAVAREWNALRAECVELSMKTMVIPELIRELRAVLLDEARDCVLKSCSHKLAELLKVAPYRPDWSDEYEEWGTVHGIRSMAIAYENDHSMAGFCAVTNSDGDVMDYMRLPEILKRKYSNYPDAKAAKLRELRRIKDFICNRKPHVIVIGGESRDAQIIQQDLNEVVKELVSEEQFPPIAVEILDNELAKIYANAKQSENDFKEYPALLKQSISLARRMQDPLVEFAQLCNADDDFLCLRYHTLQDHIPRELLKQQLQVELINRTNEVGVDINLALQDSRTASLLQFVCGFGPRKAQALLKYLKQSNQRLEDRTNLVTVCRMGPNVFMNAAAFIRIDTSSLGDSTEAFVEVLDGSRIHPETYDWARKMAVDAMEYDESTDQQSALQEILEAPEKLKDLDLDAFAKELEASNVGLKKDTLYDIRNELSAMYKDWRTPYQPPNHEQLFDMLTKETPETFYVGKIVLATVIGFVHRKPQSEQLDSANPLRIDETGKWQCPFCLKDDFPELSAVWNHFDASACVGQSVGVRVRLDNGLTGFIHLRNLSDKVVKAPEERVRIGQAVHMRIVKIDVERFSVDCTSKTSDLIDVNNEWRPRRDSCYDYDREEEENRKAQQAKKSKETSKRQYLKRSIVHEYFKNISYMDAIKLMEKMDQGDVIFRPSSKGKDRLTATWKVTAGIYQHIDVREEDKDNDCALGKTLWIANEQFEAIDEIVARHIIPMAANAREILAYKYYRDTNGGRHDKMDELLKAEKLKDPKKIQYFFSASEKFPGKFLLSYLPKLKSRHEYVTVMPSGFRFRSKMFDSLSMLLKYFKEHFADPIMTPMSVSGQVGAAGGSSSAGRHSATYTPTPTPRGGGSVDGSLSSYTRSPHFSMPASVASYNATPTNYPTNHYNTPYTPSGQTPFMTPYHGTPHGGGGSSGSHTPRYAHSAPSPAPSTPYSQHQQHGHAHHHHQQQHHHSQHYSSGSKHMPPPPPQYRASPLTNNLQNSGVTPKENRDWELAADSWARHKPITPGTTDHRPSPRQPNVFASPSNYAHSSPAVGSGTASAAAAAAKYAAAVEAERLRSKERSTPKQRQHGNTTPRVSSSPRPTNLGDATPLYDEN